MLWRCVVGEHDAAQSRQLVLGSSQRINSIAARELDVEDRDIRLAMADARDGVIVVVRLADDDVPAERIDQLDQALADLLGVFNQKNSHRRFSVIQRFIAA